MPKVTILLLFTLTNVAYSQMKTPEPIISSAPAAKKVPYKHISHGDVRLDNYHWLRDDDRKNPEVIAYLNQENTYTDLILKNEKPLIDKLYQEIITRLPSKEQTVPVKIDDYWYYSRYAEGKEYSIYARKKESLKAAEEVMIDMNDRAKDKSYFQSNYQAISPNYKILGFSEDVTGRRKYSLYFKNLETGQLYKDVIKNTTGSIVWALDNKIFFYTKKHPKTLLPYRVYRHELGSNKKDVLVYEEKDNTFYTSIYATTSKKYIILAISSTTNSESYVLDASNPTGEFVSFLPREKDHEYSIEELNDEFYIRTNWQAKNFRIMHSNLKNSKDKSQWKQIIAHNPSTLIYGVEAFNTHLAIEQRSNGIRHINLYDLKTKNSSTIQSEEPAYSMWIGYNPQQNTGKLRYTFASMTTPFSVYEYDMQTGKQTLLKRDEVVGSFKSENYQSKRLSVKARDGEEVPVSLVYKKSDIPLGFRPILVYGYGSYGSSIDPSFSYSRLSLLDRGFIFAIAHIRGSQAKGRTWYEEGKLLNKKNTFTDFIDVTKGLLQQGYGDKNQVFASGGSAGGLLMGAVVNMDGMLYKGIIAAVPFVDVVSTMLDEDIPLTTGEFDEWGNPKDKKYYDYMLSYSPYDNVSKQDYPNMMITTGLHDSQVQYWEPAKWVAKLREMKTNDNILIMRTDMDAGHGGASGRYQQYKETAEEYGFLLKLIGN
ncbi:MAG: S9 family peptidase [Proteobacteria bacterium]|nr:S9 family peptidase [Pseudomonadota bacterium]